MSKSRSDYNKYWRTPVSKQYKESRRESNRPTLLSHSTKRRTLAYYKAYRQETHVKIEKMLMDDEYDMSEILGSLRGNN